MTTATRTPPSSLRRMSLLDAFLAEGNRALQVLAGVATASRPNPADVPPPTLSYSGTPTPGTTAMGTPGVDAAGSAASMSPSTPAVTAEPGPRSTSGPAPESANAATPSTASASTSSRAEPDATYAARPDDASQPAELSPAESRHIAGLMRVNHVGEICAQALYRGQATCVRNPATRALFEKAADEEVDHLAWLNDRLRELNGRPSLLNPFWYAGAFFLGAAASRVSDSFNLGFMAETEKQVTEHLDNHLSKLPAHDQRSRRILEQMRIDESNHRKRAEHAGGAYLPKPVKGAMRAMSKVMTTTAYWV